MVAVRKSRIDKVRKLRNALPMIKPVSTAKEAIDLLGGPRKVGVWWGMQAPGVCDMARRGRISGYYAMHVFIGLRVLGYEMLPSVVGLKSWAELLPPGARGKVVKLDLREPGNGKLSRSVRL